MAANDPICAWCRPARVEDLDPATTMFYCDEHQKKMDRLLANLQGIVIPQPAGGFPLQWPAADPAPTLNANPGPGLPGLIDITADWDQPAAAPFALDMALDFIRKWEQRDVPRTPAAIVVEELRKTAIPIAVEHLAARIVDALRAHLLPEPEHTTHEYRVTWLTDSGGICMTEDRIGSEQRAQQIGATKIGTLGIASYDVERCEHRRYPDGSTWIGPWQLVDGSVPDDVKARG